MKNFKHVILVVVLLLVFVVQIVVAQGTWGDAKTFSLNGYSWHVSTTEGTWLASLKQTNNKNWDLHTVSKTMWTRPEARMVNSGRSVRSNSVVTATTGRTVTGSGNTGEIGYNYYVEVRPAALQVGTDTIRLQFKAR